VSARHRLAAPSYLSAVIDRARSSRSPRCTPKRNSQGNTSLITLAHAFRNAPAGAINPKLQIACPTPPLRAAGSLRRPGFEDDGHWQPDPRGGPADPIPTGCSSLPHHFLHQSRGDSSRGSLGLFGTRKSQQFSIGHNHGFADLRTVSLTRSARASDKKHPQWNAAGAGVRRRVEVFTGDDLRP